MKGWFEGRYASGKERIEQNRENREKQSQREGELPHVVW